MADETSPGAESTPLVDALHDRAGDALRSVSRYDEEQFELLFMREDVDAIYTPAEIEDVFDDLRLEGWGRTRVEDLFNAGALECTIHCFEEALMFHFVVGEFAGVFATIDRGAQVDIEAVIEACQAHV